MIKNTTSWLMQRRTYSGSFSLSSKSVDSFGRAPHDITDAYLFYTLTEIGFKDLVNEVKHLRELVD